MKKIFCTILSLFITLLLHAQTNRTINVYISDVKGTFNIFFNECVGAGRANEGLRADWQRQLTYAKEQCGFRYICMHGLLHDDMGVYFEDGKGNPIYNWQYIDELYDFLLSIHVRPFVEFGFMPKTLASSNVTLSFFFWKPNISPPKDYTKWSNLIKALVQHWVERYGEAEVKQWYFEVWNEPNLKSIFWSGDQAEYFKLFEATARAVKSVSADYRVGGPSTAVSACIPELIKYCDSTKTPLDFISTHNYGSDKTFWTDTSDAAITTKNMDVIPYAVKKSKHIIEQSSMPKLPLFYTEWSSGDGLFDHYRQAAYILDKLKKTGNAANAMSYWTFTDIFEERGPRATPFHDGFGMINYQDINKPAFYAYQYLNRLGKHELNVLDATSFACKDDKGNVQVLLWDFTTTIPDSINKRDYYKKDIPSNTKGKVTINYKNLPAGKYELKVYQTGYKANDPYTLYKEMGSPSQLTKQQVQTIRQKDNGAPIIQKNVLVNSNKTFSETLDLRENDVFLVTISKL
ncbi:MAG: glycoside hydrolase [Sphingobacteriales bacterium]|nr:glycoside hydrolase [Sphingobacteriales bacterium]